MASTFPRGITQLTKPFIHDDFLLQSEAARRLFHRYAKDLPIIDYHCHLPPDEIERDKRWENLSQIWLTGDHYKWRAMRTNGVSERYCTGDASDREKFDQFAATMPFLLRNPLYHWCHLELARYFDIFTLLSPETAGDIWAATSEHLSGDFSVLTVLRQSGVKIICTTDDPVDSLEHHRAIRDDSGIDVKVFPTWRPDKAIDISEPKAYNQYMDRLSEVSGIDISSFQKLLEALRKRHDYFQSHGCRLSDRGLRTIYDEPFSEAAIEGIFARVRSGNHVSAEEYRQFHLAMLIELARMDAEKGWTMQLHLGAMRNNNSKMMQRLGPDTGFDSIGDDNYARPLARFMDRLNSEDLLPKTIIYNLNPRDNEMVATMCGNFQDGETPGKIQFGSAWWFLDQKDGISRQIEVLSQMGLLSRLVGMLTDSRSFLSFPRHEYFRRVLCNIIGSEMSCGLIPDDEELAGHLVQRVCYHNAREYFGFEEA